MQIYFRDKFIDEAAAHISVNDRSFRFGDGVFETAIICNARVWDWPSHATRLQNGLEFYDLDIDISNILGIAAELIKKNKIVQGYLRVIISRGETHAVGYKIDNPAPYMVVQVASKPLPEFQTIKLAICSLRAYYHTPCKTNNALLYTRATMEADAAGCDNALLLSHDDYICETANGNLFWIKGDVLYTPSLDLPLVPGTLRQRILDLWDGEVEQGKFNLDALSDADEIFMSNVGGIVTIIGKIQNLEIKIKSQSKTAQLRDEIIKQIKSA